MDCVPPLASVQLSAVPPNSSLRPPVLADIALEVFARISQSDVNRQSLARAISQRVLWQLLTSLVHRVPMIEADFLLMQRDYWQSYVEKTIMGIYSLIFMAPYGLKQKIQVDKRLGIKTVLLRMAQGILLVNIIKVIRTDFRRMSTTSTTGTDNHYCACTSGSHIL
jgi:SWI/SNF chromatin-remodeling complex subunit SWI1